MRLQDSCRHSTGLHHLMQLRDGGFGELAQLGRELDFAPAFARRVENRAAPDPGTQDLLQTERLRAKLHVIVIEFSPSALLVFNRKERAVRALLDNVALAGEPQPF